MKLYKTFLFPVFLLASCTASQSTLFGNNTAGASGVGSVRNLNTSDSTSNLQGATIDRNKLNAVPVRIKNMNPDSIPKP